MKYEIKITSINPPMYCVPSDDQIKGLEPVSKVPTETKELVYTRLIITENIGDVLKAIEDSK